MSEERLVPSATMTAGIEERPLTATEETGPKLSIGRRLRSGFSRFATIHVFTSLTRRIIVLNLAALVVLVTGILLLNQFRAGLIDARVSSLLIQGEIIAGAIAASATADTDTISVDPDKLLELQTGQSISPNDQPFESTEFSINPEKVAPVLRRLISPTGTRARIYDRDANLLKAFPIGSEIEVVVLEVDPAGRRIRVSRKAVAEQRERAELIDYAQRTEDKTSESMGSLADKLRGALGRQ